MSLGYPMHITAGTSASQMIFVTSIGASILTLSGYQNFEVLLEIAIPTLVASYLGGITSRKTRPWQLKLAYGVLALAVGIYIVLESTKYLYYLYHS